MMQEEKSVSPLLETLGTEMVTVEQTKELWQLSIWFDF